MTIAGDCQAPIRLTEPSPDLNSSSGLRHRRPPGAPAASVSSSCSEASPPSHSAEIAVTTSSEESSVDTASSDLTAGPREGEEEKPLNGADEVPGVAKGEEGRDAGGGAIPANFMYRAAAPAHRRVKESPLSSDAIFQQSHAGLLNLCIVVLIAVNSRLIIENLMKYGLLIRAGFWFSSSSLRNWPILMCCLTLPAFPIGAFIIEKLAYRKYISKLLVIFLHVLLTTTAILYPVYVILRHDSAVLSGFNLMFVASIVWLKLVSYAHTNYDIRAILNDKDQVSFIFPDLTDVRDVSFRSLGYFMLAPTLCYQVVPLIAIGLTKEPKKLLPHYPHTTCIRKSWLTRQLVKCVIFTGLMGFIIEQYINPIVQNSQHPLKGDLLHALERILKLSVPTLYVWLCMFYCFFHLWLNILAELLCFGDREFYKDWWNAKTIEEYWRMWNMPVHKWMIRHIYFPCLRNGIPKGVAVLISFFVSAIFHEICIAVPCHIFKFWAFIGIMFQVPLVILTKYLQNKFRNTMVGNMIFWFFFSIVGQPMCVLLYYHDVMNRKVMIE